MRCSPRRRPEAQARVQSHPPQESRKGLGRKGHPVWSQMWRCSAAEGRRRGEVRQLCQEDTIWPDRPPAQRPSLICLAEAQGNHPLRAPATLTTHPQKYCQ